MTCDHRLSADRGLGLAQKIYFEVCGSELLARIAFDWLVDLTNINRIRSYQTPLPKFEMSTRRQKAGKGRVQTEEEYVTSTFPISLGTPDLMRTDTR